jgi:hypothetical protein
MSLPHLPLRLSCSHGPELAALQEVASAAKRYAMVRVAGCSCCNPEACDACPTCPKCELDAALAKLESLGV